VENLPEKVSFETTKDAEENHPEKTQRFFFETTKDVGTNHRENRRLPNVLL